MNLRLFFILTPFVTVSFFTWLVLWEGWYPSFFIASNSWTVSGTISQGVDNIDMGLFHETLSVLQEHYIDYPDTDYKKLSQWMVRGMVEGLGDKHTVYFDPKETQSFHESLDGEFEGIGAYVGKNDLGVEVTKVMEGSPALQGDIRAGDVIIKADDTELSGMTVQEAIEYIRWPAGSIVHLSILRPGENSILTKAVTRAHVDIPSTVSKTIDLPDGKKIGYIGMAVFAKNTDIEFFEAYKKLLSENVSGLIIDLRYNPGGFLEAAVNILSNFTEKNKLLVRTQSRDPSENIRYVSKWNAFPDLPIVVLVDENSASASEIVSGALQDYELAIIVGTTTYGKWSVQKEFGLSDGGEVKVTIAKWLTPNGHTIDGIGIKPDIEVDFTPEDYKNMYDRQLETAKETLGALIDSGTRDVVITSVRQKLAQGEVTWSGAIVENSTGSGTTNE